PSRTEDRPAATDLRRPEAAGLHSAGQTAMNLVIGLFRSLVIGALMLQAAAAPKFDSNRAWQDLRQLVAIGPRPAGSPAIEQTRKYIKEQLAAAGVAVTEQAWDDQTPLGKTHMVNLIATIPGLG